MGKFTNIEHSIDPSHLMYHAVRSHPLIQVSELDALIFAALCSFVLPDGDITITEEQREYIQKGLSVSPQQMSNVITRLVGKEYLIRQPGHGHYSLPPRLMDLTRIPKLMKKTFMIKFKANEPSLSTQSTSIDIRDMEGNDPQESACSTEVLS